jgi:glycosyltransferase involved in cell wall biosynthesis
MQVVRNVPLKKIVPAVGKPLSFLPEEKFVLYQGVLNKGRGLELLIDAFAEITGYACVIAGDGDIASELKQRVKTKKLENKVFFIGRVPLEELHALTCCASLGVSIEEHLGMNYYYALPNKFFDYIQARVPVLVSGFPEMQKIVEEYAIGEILKSRNPKECAQQITAMLQSPQREMWKHNLETASEELNWEKEKVILLEMFNKLLK